MRSGLLIIALVFLTYRGCWENGFHFDDWRGCEGNPSVEEFHPWRWLTDRTCLTRNVSNQDWRPLVVFSFGFNRLALKGRMWGWHLVNILLHSWVSLCVLLIGRELLKNERLALLIAALYAVHPIGTVAIDYSWARSSTLVACCLLPALLMELRGRWVAAVVWMAVGLLAKVEAASAVLLFGLVAYRRRSWSWSLVAAPLVFAGYCLLRTLTMGDWLQRITMAPWDRWTYARTQTYVWWRYLLRVFVPLDLTPDDTGYGWAWSWSALVVVSLVGWVLLAWATWKLSREDEEIARSGWLLACAAAVMLPHSSLLTLNEPHNEHRPYLAAAFVLLAAGPLISRALARLDIPRLPVAVLLVCCASWAATERSRDWKDEVTLWSACVRADPSCFRSRMNLGVGLMQRNRLVEARQQFEISSHLNPQNGPVYINLGIVYWHLHDFAASEKAWAEAVVHTSPDEVYAWRNRSCHPDDLPQVLASAKKAKAK